MGIIGLFLSSVGWAGAGAGTLGVGTWGMVANGCVPRFYVSLLLGGRGWRCEV